MSNSAWKSSYWVMPNDPRDSVRLRERLEVLERTSHRTAEIVPVLDIPPSDITVLAWVISDDRGTSGVLITFGYFRVTRDTPQEVWRLIEKQPMSLQDATMRITHP